MFVNDAGFAILGFEIIGVNFFEQILEAAIIGLQDGVLGRKIHRPAAIEAIVQAGAGEVADAVVKVVHAHGDARRREFEYLFLDHARTILRFPAHGQLAGAGHLEIGGAILVTKGMAADDDGIGPARHEARHGLDDDGFAEHHAAQDVADGAVGRFPHPLQSEFLHAGFVGRDGGAFHTNAELLDRIGGINRDLVVAIIPAFHAEVVIAKIDVEIGQNQLLADPLPDDAGHLVAVELDNGVFDLDLRHLVLPALLRRFVAVVLGGGGRAGQWCQPLFYPSFSDRAARFSSGSASAAKCGGPKPAALIWASNAVSGSQ